MFPAIAWWVGAFGWIEVGHDGMSPSWIRALDEGGLIWEGKPAYASVDEGLQALEAGLTAWLEENGFQAQEEG
jgi:hypothetical protein